MAATGGRLQALRKWYALAVPGRGRTMRGQPKVVAADA